MAGGAAKKAAVRQRGASRAYVAVALVANALFFGVRLWARRAWLTRGEVAGVALLEGLYFLSVYSLIQAAALGTSAELAFDVFVLAVAVQLGALLSPRAWYLLLLLPAYGLWSFRGPLLAITMQPGRGDVAAAAAADAAGLASTGAADDDVMAAKRKRRAEHKEKMRQMARR